MFPAVHFGTRPNRCNEGANAVRYRDTIIFAVLLRVIDAAGISGVASPKELVTWTEMVVPGAAAEGFVGVAVTVTAKPGERLSTYVCNCAAVAGIVLLLPRTEAQRAPSCARLETVLYCHTARPN